MANNFDITKFLQHFFWKNTKKTEKARCEHPKRHWKGRENEQWTMIVCRDVDTAMQYTRQGAKAFNTSICRNLHLTFVCIKEPQIPRIKRILSLPLMQIFNGFSEKIFVTTRQNKQVFCSRCSKNYDATHRFLQQVSSRRQSLKSKTNQYLEWTDCKKIPQIRVICG